ncbi:hypothetical protein EYF80_024867 [Liparis tanakae]|uniref:Uncharacterized protein n=1 Tax=Liparis tanakae TaxID=230148 RepID=A0A4Z2HG79_9TELE|nr:hypothetical protein EYF80_024867 [Liparis tanakae]
MREDKCPRGEGLSQWGEGEGRGGVGGGAQQRAKCGAAAVTPSSLLNVPRRTRAVPAGTLPLRASPLARGPTVNLIRAALTAEGGPPQQTARQAEEPEAVEVTSRAHSE